MKRCVVLSGLVFLFMILTVSYVSATDLTADMITKEGKITSKGKIWVNGNKMRAEKGNTPIYNIVRGDKGLLWQINGAENTYVQAKLAPTMNFWTTETIPGEIGRKEVGSEKIENHPVKKYEVSVKQGKTTNTYYQWLATDLKFPVKIANANGKWSVEYKNIKKGLPSDAVFNLPAGATIDSMSVPDVLSGGGH
ncbi:MAG: hypothetical protein ACYDHW_08290 [Syntrophorhabdaceae bacterium]